jgi:outer membrane protein assembly factor BamB
MVTGTPAGTFTLDGCIEWSGSEILGDSGAPIGDGNSFLGIGSATNGTDAWFSKAINVQPVTGATLHY